MDTVFYFFIALVVLAIVLVKKSLVIIPQSETKIIERLGKYYATLRPGINIIIPFIDRAKDIVAMRNGRYVVPVKVEYRGEVKGLVHDTSASGATLFVEPMSVVEANNELRVLQVKEQNEIERILTEPNASITVQYKALMATEGVNIEFTDSGIKRIAEAAWQVNESTENIGARRLHTVLERLMEEISYDASDLSGQNITIDADYVSKHLDALVADEDLSRFIL